MFGADSARLGAKHAALTAALPRDAGAPALAAIMTAPRFLVDTGRLGAERALLDGPEGRHAATVRRIAVGERVELTDGAGAVAECVAVRVGRDELELEVVARRQEPVPSPWLVVVQALAKGDRGERAVELLTEIGVDEILPWGAARSVPQWRAERGAKALARWRSTGREAAKQSRRSRLPVIGEPASTSQVVDRLRTAALPIVLHEDAHPSLCRVQVPAAGEVVVVVGPEGGLTTEELAALGGATYRLGPTVLRTSTAGVAAVAVLLAKTGRWG